MNPSKVSNALRLIIENYGTYLRYRLLGLKALSASQRKRLARSGLVRPSDLTAPTVTDAYLEAHVSMLKQPQSRKQIRDYALQHIRESAGARVDLFAEKMAVDLNAIASQQLLTHHHEVIAQTRQSLAESYGKKTTRTIARELREKTGELYRDWDRIANSELARAHSMGCLDAVIENTRDRAPEEVYVYKVGVADHKRCEHCTKFWTLNGSPRIYRLSELLANGDNFGRKISQWKPTVSPTHPNCREIGPLELPIGWSVAGGIHYVSRDHNEFKAQRGAVE